MSIADESSQAFHQGTAPFFSLLTPDQIRRLAELQGDPTVADRLAELAVKANEGELSESERAVYEAYIEADNLLAVLQAEAKFRVSELVQKKLPTRQEPGGEAANGVRRESPATFCPIPIRGEPLSATVLAERR